MSLIPVLQLCLLESEYLATKKSKNLVRDHQQGGTAQHSDINMREISTNTVTPGKIRAAHSLQQRKHQQAHFFAFTLIFPALDPHLWILRSRLIHKSAQHYQMAVAPASVIAFRCSIEQTGLGKHFLISND